MTDFSSLQTPALLLDIDRLTTNSARMIARAKEQGVSFRPHVKTHKSARVLNICLPLSEPQKVMVSTLKEAQYFFDHGVRDFMYGVGISPDKLSMVASLIDKGAAFSVVLDDAANAKKVCDEGERLGQDFAVYIEIDTDGHRAGVPANAPELLAIAEVLAQNDGAHLAGVVAHAGDSYDCESAAEITAHAELERSQTVLAAERLRAAGFECVNVSVGSTPTAMFAEHLDGVSELRAGVYSFFDLFQAGLGACAIDDIAVSVLATVIGKNTAKNTIITDAGWMAMSRDRSTATQKIDQGYGLVCDVNGKPIGGLIVKSANQEHGLIAPMDDAPLDFDQFPVGTKLRILPNHACATAAQYDRYYAFGERQPMEEWPRISGW